MLEINESNITIASLITNINKIHSTEMGLSRISRNLKLDNSINPIDYCKKIILNKDCNITIKGKNYYVLLADEIITINRHSFTIITAHKIKK